MQVLAVKRFFSAAIVVGVAAAMAAFGATSSLDRLLAEFRYGIADRDASGQVVFIDIDSASLAEVGVWPWPRDLHARLLDALMAADVTDVAFDIDFSTRSTTPGDDAFAAALERAGGYAYLAAFQQRNGTTGQQMINLPLEEFTEHAEPVSVNVMAARDGWVDRVSAYSPEVKTLASALTGITPAGETVSIDFGINLETIPRIAAADVLMGRFSPQQLAGRQAVVGASAIELRDIVQVPRFGLIPGPLVQIAAAETLRSGRSLLPLGWWPAALVASLLGAAWALVGERMSLRAVAVSSAVAAAVVELAALWLQWAYAITLTTSALTLAMPMLISVDIAARLLSEFGRRREAEQKLAWMALHDQLTGLDSREGFLNRTAAVGSGAIIVLQLQRLDAVRAALGHGVADEVTKVLARRLEALHLGQLGVIDKDTFGIALPGRMDSETADRLGVEIREALAPAVLTEGHAVHVDARIAGCCAPMVDTRTRLRRAELALMLEADLAPGAIKRYEPELEAALQRRRELDTALREALEKGELQLAFQPQARISSGEIVGAEALMRWEDPRLGRVSPAEFVPLAEETGLIVPLGRFAMFEACRLATTEGWPGRIAVNVSADQFRLSDVPEMVADALLQSGMEASRLDIEITESVLLGGGIEDALDELKRLGVGIAIDDFGTGYSSLSYLTRLSFDKLKLDQHFVRRMLDGKADEVVVRGIIELATRLGKETVAEGVETQGQMDALAILGCDIAQGWLIGRPLPAREFLTFAARKHELIAQPRRA